jgi:hypothetical protein
MLKDRSRSASVEAGIEIAFLYVKRMSSANSGSDRAPSCLPSDAAGLALGLSLMSPAVRAQERAVKIGFVTSEAVCWRAGMRNQ